MNASKPASLFFGAMVEIGYVLRHPRRSFRHAEYNLRQWRAARDFDRSAAKRRHPSMVARSEQFREEVAQRDAERILKKAALRGRK